MDLSEHSLIKNIRRNITFMSSQNVVVPNYVEDWNVKLAEKLIRRHPDLFDQSRMMNAPVIQVGSKTVSARTRKLPHYYPGFIDEEEAEMDELVVELGDLIERCVVGHTFYPYVLAANACVHNGRPVVSIMIRFGLL